MGWKESESLVKKVKQNKICGEDSWWERDEKQVANKAVDNLLLYKIQYKQEHFTFLMMVYVKKPKLK